MQSRSPTVVLPVIMLIGAAVAGCSSSPPVTPPDKGGLAPGTAQVTIDETGTTTSDAVACAPTTTLTMITTKGPTGGVTAMIDNASALEVKSVRIDDQGGFSGTYIQGLQGQADVEMIGNTFKITGVAEGDQDFQYQSCLLTLTAKGAVSPSETRPGGRGAHPLGLDRALVGW